MNSAFIQVAFYLRHSDSAMFSNVTTIFATLHSRVHGKLHIWGVVVVFLFYLTESVIGQDVLYNFLAETCGRACR